MSTSQYPPEIVSAKNKLKNFDLAEGYEKLQYVVEFSDGIWSINKYLKSNPNTPFIDKITNLKRAHARRLLRHIQRLTLNNINMSADKFYYLFMLICKDLEKEVEFIVDNHHELSNVKQQFYQTYSHLCDHLITEFKRFQ